MSLVRSETVVKVGLSLVVWAGVLTAPALGRNTIRLQNDMTTRITVRLKAAQQQNPAEFNIPRNGILNFPIDFAGPYSIEVVPADQPNSRYILGKVNLGALALAVQGQPVILRGKFRLVRTHRGIFQERIKVLFDMRDRQGRGVRYSVGRNDY
jgi:hypothetical protein